MKPVKKILVLLIWLAPVALLAFALFFNERGNNRYELITDMDRQAKVNPQESDSYFPDSSSVSLPDEHIISKNGKVYPYHQTEYEIADSLIKNPLKPDKFILNRGKKRFETFCMPCHGERGRADGTVITDVEITETEEGFPAPPDYLSQQTKALSDARIFHIISTGQNAMFAAAYKLEEWERWAIVLYVRKLQQNDSVNNDR